jgi:hypothetical protein
MSGCAESKFVLAPDSRVPKWFAVPPDVSRKDVTVTMAFYDLPTGKSVTFKLWDTAGRKLAQVSASVSPDNPHAFGPPSPHGGVDEGSYPLYAVVTANGITEVIEHRKMEPTFYTTDDPAVKAALGVK